MSANTEEKPETIELNEEKNNEESGTPKKVDFSKVFSSAMTHMSSNIRKKPNKRTKREEVLSEEESSDEDFSEEDEDSETETEEEDLRWTTLNKLLESHLNITKTLLTMVKETKNE